MEDPKDFKNLKLNSLESSILNEIENLKKQQMKALNNINHDKKRIVQSEKKTRNFKNVLATEKSEHSVKTV